ncbi:MAG: hypothetical protein ABI878_13460 [Acidobacteriota bacterium]
MNSKVVITLFMSALVFGACVNQPGANNASVATNAAGANTGVKPVVDRAGEEKALRETDARVVGRGGEA